MTNETKSTGPVVGILMGSDSDWPTMKAAAEALKEFGLASEARRTCCFATPRKRSRAGSR